MITNETRRLVQAIDTANLWSSDQSGRGLALLSLGTTRQIHSEEHREQCLREIDNNIAWSESFSEHSLTAQNDISRLRDLRELVVFAAVKHEWLTDAENMRWNEYLWRRNEL